MFLMTYSYSFLLLAYSIYFRSAQSFCFHVSDGSQEVGGKEQKMILF